MNPPIPIILNGSYPNAKEIGRFILAISSPDHLARAGGFLFKSCLTSRGIHIGIVPAISDGERRHHYDICVPENEYLIGSISAKGEFSLLFQADTQKMGVKERSRWQDQYQAFATALLQRDYPGEGVLDWITRKIIQEAQLFHPLPMTLKEIIS